MDHDELIGQTLSHYKVLEKLGQGGMGVVYRAIDLQLDRTVALKVLPAIWMPDPERKRRFIQEAKTASSLNHPNIITIYEIGAAPPESRPEAHPVNYIAMEFVAGKTLYQVIGRKGMPIPDILKYAVQIADALSAAHATGIVHRDLKPGNVMVTGPVSGRPGLVKVLDFGLAKLMERIEGDELTMTVDMTPRTLEGMIVGTFAYMSPEQAEGKKVDARSDIFSFGSVLYEMVTGHHPFQGETHMSTMAAIINKEPRPISEIMEAPPELERLILRCLRKEPERRVQHMDDLKVALEELRDESVSGRLISGVSSLRAAPAPPAPPRVIPMRLALGVILLAVIGGALFFWWWISRSPAPLQQPVLTNLTSDSGLSAYPALSPDGKLLAYASDRGGHGNLDIWLQQVGGGQPIRLTRDEADDYEPSFSPDGTKLVFCSEREGGGVYIISTLGGEERLIAAHGRRPVFSPDGARVAYYWYVGGGAGKVYVVDSSGGSPAPIQPAFYNARSPVWSPDGQRLLFHGIRDPKLTPEESTDWWVAPIDGGPPVKTGALAAFARQGLSPPPATRIFTPGLWTGEENYVIFSARLGDTTNLWRVPISPRSGNVTGIPQRITLGTALEMQPSYASPGLLAFASLTKSIDVWALGMDANQAKVLNGLQRLTEDAAPDTQVSISGDGTKVAFISTRAGNNDVWLKDLASGKETALTASPGTEWNPIISPDGTKVAYGTIEAQKVSKIYVISTGSGRQPALPEKVCDDCGSSLSWSSDGTKLLYERYPPAVTRLLDLSTRQSFEVLRHPEYDLWQSKFSPDDRWITFMATTSPVRSRLYIAPFHDTNKGQPVGVNEWVPVTDGESWDDKPRWSPDGKMLYFISGRDGFLCIWMQRLDGATKRPLGSPLPVYHLHRARLSMTNVDLGPLEMSVARDKIVFSLGELTGNIWMAKLKP